MGIKFFRFLLILILAPCGMATAQQTQAQTEVSAPIGATSSAQQGYRLGPGDQLRIDVFGEDDLSRQYTVGASGDIDFPLLGKVPVAGVEADALAAMLTQSLQAGYIQHPRVTVQVTSYRPFYILGEVQRPGTYPYSADLTVMNAVATAGGYTYRANTGRVYIKHPGEAAEHAVPLDSATPVAPGDTIRIGERFF